MTTSEPRILESKDLEETTESKQDQVIVRAVFINCEPSEEQNFLENEVTRFQREELFKHNALQGCHKKLALTIKIESEPDESFGDEYIPIEHVFDGLNKRRSRLLAPYILRLRRETPLQAYKLRRIDTVTGIISKSDDRRSNKPKKNRVQRNLVEQKNDRSSEDPQGNEDCVSEKQSSSTTDKHKNAQIINQCGNSENTNFTNERISLTSKESTLMNISLGSDSEPTLDEVFSKRRTTQDRNEYVKDNTRVKRDTCTLANNPAWKRERRNEHNIIVEDVTDDYKIPWTVKDRTYRESYHSTKTKAVEHKRTMTSNEDLEKDGRKDMDPELLLKTKSHSQRNQPMTERSYSKEKYNNQITEHIKHTSPFVDRSHRVEESTHRSLDVKPKHTSFETHETSEKNFVLYDIGNPDLWYSVHVQLFEKMSTPEGKTVWNDITKGEVARVSTLQPEWTDPDLNIRYKPTEWMTKDEFALPAATSLCLVALKEDDRSMNLDDDVAGLSKYIVVPKDDIVGLEDTASGMNKRHGNYSHATASDYGYRNEQGHRRVLVRVSRALLTDEGEELKIASIGSDRYLTLPHRLSHRAQIDLEARADDNQLIRVGSSGSLITIVADNSRRTRSVITVQATNKGLAAARFRVKARDCGPEMASLIGEKSEGITAGPILVPPKHTQRFRLELPTGIPVDTIHCSVVLINDDEESVAVRDVAIKKGDRCFCVWHCDCVCLNEDPKLLCREMGEARQAAAGLSPRERARRARSACYSDCATLNLAVIAVGVLIGLLGLGLIKSCFGMICHCVSQYGLSKLVKLPRKLDHYYESELRDQPVIYDEEGWPVHPTTKERTVHVISGPLEFILNLTIFITIPCLVLRDILKQLITPVIKTIAAWLKLCPLDSAARGRGDKNCYSAQDMQGLQPRWRQRREGLRRWMTPQAEELSTDIWSKGLTTRKSVTCEFMRPLLNARPTDDVPSSCVDSEQDDTEYVLMQMQKSKESLARNQKKLSEQPGTTSARKQINTETKASHSVTR